MKLHEWATVKGKKRKLMAISTTAHERDSNMTVLKRHDFANIIAIKKKGFMKLHGRNLPVVYYEVWGVPSK